MWRIFCVFVIYIIFSPFIIVENSGFNIPLFRQRTPKDAIFNTENVEMLEQHGVFLNWIKSQRHHHHKNGSTRTNDSIALYRFLDTEFYGYVVVGHPGKTFKVVFDTAWRTSWLMSSECSWKTVGCWFHDKYNHKKSSTYKANGTKFEVAEGNYNFTGYYSYENFSVAHSRVNKQLFVEMTWVPYTYIFSKADGVIGLALKTDDSNPFFYNILNQTNITVPIFSIYLNRDRQSKRGGNLILGGIDEKHIHVTNKKYDKITYVPVNKTNGWWQFNIDAIAADVGKKSYVLCSDGCNAIADSSGNNIIGPKKAVHDIYNLTDATEFFFGYYKVTCDTVNKLPPINFIIAGNTFTLKGEDYTQKLSWDSFTFCLMSFVASNDNENLSNIWVLGGAFLSEFYSIYDIGNLQMGFVKAA